MRPKETPWFPLEIVPQKSAPTIIPKEGLPTIASALTLYDLPNIVNGDIQKLIDELQLYQNTQILKEAGEVL